MEFWAWVVFWSFCLLPLGFVEDVSGSRVAGFGEILVEEWIHFTLFGIILPTIKLKVYTFGGL